MLDEDGELSLHTIFTELARPPSPPASFALYVREVPESDPNEWVQIEIRLVGSHCLWGHYLWNAARAFATYLDQNPRLYRHRSVLELGAGGGLPGIVTAKNGARKVVLTDYPDEPLLDNLRHNVEVNIPDTLRHVVEVEGYIWGRNVSSLLRRLPDPLVQSGSGFDLVILSDLIFNHSQHEALLSTCEQVLARSCNDNDDATPPCILVFYSHNRPGLAHKDMVFFHLAKQKGWTCEEVLKRKYAPMFPDDPGDEDVRSTVHGWQLTRAPAK
ncbi:hypothetical protein APHAL10511_008150 [Amanita phalloides]|nr:hypothetical protein APHAL10511_008150 [Amanita phalloides]